MKKAVTFLLFLCLLVCGAAACGGETGKNTESSESEGTGTDMNERFFEGYRIVYSYRKLNARDVVIAETLRDRIDAIYGIHLDIVDDAEEQQDKEIIIGKTKRSESDELYSSLDKDKFGGYAVKGSKILIFGSTDVILDGAADFFTYYVLGYDNSAKKTVSAPKLDILSKDGVYYIDGSNGEETLYNGIALDGTWPPRTVDYEKNTVIEAPYLKSGKDGGTHPEAVDIDVGRQLFVDSFLIGETDLTASYHTAKTYDEPIITLDGDYLILKGGSFIYDSDTDKLVIWYGGMRHIYRSESSDGVNWSEPEIVFNNKKDAPWSTVWINPNPSADGSDKYILFLRDADGKFTWENHYETTRFHGEIYKSPDGKEWTFAAETGALGDASLISYNYFRNKWLIYGRDNCSFSSGNRVVRYYECDDIVKQASYRLWESVEWQRTDKDDKPDKTLNQVPQFYSVSSNSYESIQLGVFQYWLGPVNSECRKTGIPKITELQLGYSRDGFHYTRPERETPFISCSRTEGAWDRGYLHIASSLCVATNDELWFCYAGYRGGETDQKITEEYANPSIGIAKLRRDGFVSLDGTGSVTTEKITFNENKKLLFVNASAKSIKAEILDADGKVLDGFSADDCTAFSGDSCSAMLSFGEGKDLSFLRDREFRIRFIMEDGEFYSFWLSPDENGESGGYTCGGLIPRNTAEAEK